MRKDRTRGGGRGGGRRWRRVRIAVAIGSALYAAHPLVATGVAHRLLDRHWNGPVETGWVALLPTGNVWMSRLRLRAGPEGTGTTVEVSSLVAEPAWEGWKGWLPRWGLAGVSCRKIGIRLGAVGAEAGGRTPEPKPRDAKETRPFSVRLAFRSADLALSAPDGPAIAGVSGTGRLRTFPNERRVKLHLTVRQDQWAEGEILCAVSTATRAADWDFSFEGLRVNGRLRGMLPPLFRVHLDRTAPDGLADLRLRARTRPGFPPDVSGTLEWKEGRITLPPPANLPLAGVQGRIQWDSDGILVESLSGRFGPTLLEIRGRADFPGRRAGAGDGKFHFGLQTSGETLTTDLRDRLPSHLRQTWDLLAPAGRLDLDVSVSGRMAGEVHPLSASFQARFSEVAMTGLSPPFREIQGEMELELIGCGESLRGEGEARLAAIRIGPVHLEHVRIPLFLRAEGDSRILELGGTDRPIQAACAGGILRGTIRYVHGQTPIVTVVSDGLDLHLERLVEELSPPQKERAVSGKVSYTLEVRHDLSGPRGTLELRIQKGDLGRIPTLQGVMDRLIGRDRAATSKLTGLRGTFQIHPHKITVSELTIHGKRIAFYATEGTFRYGGGGDIDVTFFAGVRDDTIRKIPVIRSIWRTLSSLPTGAFSVRITGTVRAPRYSVEPLRAPTHAILKPLQDIFLRERE